MEDLEGWRTIGQLEGKVDGLVTSVHAMTSTLTETRQEIKQLSERMTRLEQRSSGVHTTRRIREIAAFITALAGAGGSATMWQKYTTAAAQLEVQQHAVIKQPAQQAPNQPQR
jgi:hypothetical protein